MKCILDFLFKIFHLYYVYRCFTRMYVCGLYAYLVFVKARKGTGSPGSAVVDDCEPLDGHWELNLGPLK